MPARKKTAAAAKPTRTYLSREERKQALLEVAAQIVEREGWTALNMSVLAEQGGTSRQWVYQHFPKLEQLLAETAWHIFNDTMRGTRDSIAAHSTSLSDAVKAAEAVTLDMPEGRADVLWQLIAGTAGAGPELENIRKGLRQLIGGVWMPPVRKSLGLNEADARAYAWMTVMAFWGMRQLVRDGEISRVRGMKLFNDLVERIARE